MTCVGSSTRWTCPRSADKQRQVLYAVFKYAIMRGWRPDNPVQSVSFRKAAETELVVCSPEQVALLARSADDSTVSTMMIVAAATGLRQGELLALRWRHVRFAEQAIDVVASYSGGLEETSPKGRRRRSVPMADAAAAELARLRQRPYFTSPNDLVFCGATGGFIDPASVRTRYDRALGRVREDDPTIPRARFHDLRHTFGTVCAREGCDVVSIMRWLGHADLKTTEIYRHYAPKTEQAARLSTFFASLDQPTGTPTP